MKTSVEDRYIHKRLLIAHFQSAFFYLFRILPIKKKRITFTCIEGTTGFSCNPKYIALELLRRNQKLPKVDRWELVWLVDDTTKRFPRGIRVKKNTLINRAFMLTTSKFWIDNSRKQLECRKRKEQIYIQTWHAKLGFKPTCLDRGNSFSKIAYLISRHDSDRVDYWLSNSDWYDKTLRRGSLYIGKSIRTGSPRCDILISEREKIRKKIRMRYRIPSKSNIVMLCPTFRGGSQNTYRELEKNSHLPNIDVLLNSLKKRFGGEWIGLLRLHPQLTARGISDTIRCSKTTDNKVIDVSKEDDMYEILAGCDIFVTDYSSAAFDAASMRIPVFLYCDDYIEYEKERGKLLWDLTKLPFPFSKDQETLQNAICLFDEKKYQVDLDALFSDTGMVEDGHAAERVANYIINLKR